jgi:hypothetical protein
VLRTSAFCLAVAAILVSPSSYGDLPRGVEIRAYINDSCIVSDEPFLFPSAVDDQFERSFSVAGFVVGKLAHTLLSGFVNATSSQLGAMSKPRDMYYVAAKDFNLYHTALYESPRYDLNRMLSCATVVAAAFEVENVDCTHLYEPKVLSALADTSDDLASRATREDTSTENILRRANICLRGPAHSIYEARFEKSDDRTAYRLESAGLWVNSLLSTKSKKAARGIVYTMDIAEPSKDSDMHVLSSAWVNLGEVKAGYASDEPAFSSRSEWLRVPAMSATVWKAYQIDTSVHQDVYGEIQALQRSITRNQRQLDGMRLRMANASDNIKGAIQDEMDGLELRILRSESLLDARRAEYQDLPLKEINYMPVTIRFGIIESRSEKRAMGTLAAFLDKNSSRIVSTTEDKMGIERSADIADIPGSGDQEPLDHARTNYFDALVAYRESSYNDSHVTADVERSLALARDSYNSERSAAGITPIQ